MPATILTESCWTSAPVWDSRTANRDALQERATEKGPTTCHKRRQSRRYPVLLNHLSSHTANTKTLVSESQLMTIQTTLSTRSFLRATNSWVQEANARRNITDLHSHLDTQECFDHRRYILAMHFFHQTTFIWYSRPRVTH